MLDVSGLKEVRLDNGNTQYYEIVNTTAFEVGMLLKDGTMEDYSGTVDDKLISIISDYITSQKRVRIWYGDTKTGRAWNEEFEVTGRLSRSCGALHIPIFLSNSRSCYGGALLISSIVRIDDIGTKKTIWKVDNFHVEEMTVITEELPTYSGDSGCYPYKVVQKKDDGTLENIANFKTRVQADNWINFMTGKTYRK